MHAQLPCMFWQPFSKRKTCCLSACLNLLQHQGDSGATYTIVIWLRCIPNVGRQATLGHASRIPRQLPTTNHRLEAAVGRVPHTSHSFHGHRDDLAILWPAFLARDNQDQGQKGTNEHSKHSSTSRTQLLRIQQF